MLGYSLQTRFGWSNNEYYFSQFPVLYVQGTLEHTSLIISVDFLDVTISVSLDDAVFLRFIGFIGCVAQWAERRSLAGELTLSCARPAADG